MKFHQLINLVKLKFLVLAVGVNPGSNWAWKLKAEAERGAISVPRSYRLLRKLSQTLL